MNLSKFKPKNPFKIEQLNADSAFSNQIFNTSLDNSALIESFKENIYNKISSLCKASTSYQLQHFVAVPYPVYLKSEEIEDITHSFSENGYMVSYNQQLGYYVVSWNHKYRLS